MNADRSETQSRIYRDVLLHRMEEISEDHWCAGWYSGIEFHLWYAVEAFRNGDSCPMYAAEAETLSILSEDCGGWWNGYEQFVSLDEWLPLYKEWCTDERLAWLRGEK